MAGNQERRAEFVLFDVVYEDGSQRSNRKVPRELLGGLDGDAPARTHIEQQDREIAAKSGMPPLVGQEPAPLRRQIAQPAPARRPGQPARCPFAHSTSVNLLPLSRDTQTGRAAMPRVRPFASSRETPG